MSSDGRTAVERVDFTWDGAVPAEQVRDGSTALVRDRPPGGDELPGGDRSPGGGRLIGQAGRVLDGGSGSTAGSTGS